MPLKTSFQIIESPEPILETTTKFGGQPVWTHDPQWPLTPETDEKMLFLGQIALDQKLFPNSNSTMVYLFFSEESEPVYDEAFAAVIQTPENTYTSGHEIKFVTDTAGPAIYELDGKREAVHKEYRVTLEPEEDETPTPLRERYTTNDLDLETGFRFARPDLAGNKIGGQPLYIQGLDEPPEYFTSDTWIPLMQLAPTQGYWSERGTNFYPFYMELGEFGILNVFLSKDHKRAAFYVQQP